MKMRWVLLQTAAPVLLTIALLTSTAAAAALPSVEAAANQTIIPVPARVTVSRFRTPPKIDGKIGEGEWRRAAGTYGFLNPGAAWGKRRGKEGARLDARLGRTYVGFDREALYICVVSELPPDKRLITNQEGRDGRVVFDDSIEIWINPYPGEEEGEKAFFYQAICNSKGVFKDLQHSHGGATDTGWDADWETANTIDEENMLWISEIKLPLADIGLDSQKIVGHEIGLLVARNFKRGWNQAPWMQSGGAFHRIQYYPRVAFRENAPVVQIRTLGEKVFTGALEMDVEVFNPGPAQEAKVVLRIESTDMPGLDDEKILKLPANGVATYEFNVDEQRLHEDATHTLSFRVLSPDGGEAYMAYGNRWTQAPEKKWYVKTGPQPKRAVELEYYPSYGFIRVRVDEFYMEDAATEIDRAEVFVKNEEGEVLLSDEMSWKKTPYKQRFEVGNLPDGEYKAVIRIAGDDFERTFERPFLRKTFNWENNSLGQTKRAIPPFKPLTREDRTVSAVMRRHKYGGLGFWDSVEARGNPPRTDYREILAAPMRLLAGADDAPVEGSGEFTLVDGGAVVYEGRVQAPGATIRTRNTIEVDGVMKVELTLAPGKEKEPLSGLALEIPIKDEMAPLWHVVRNTIRQNPVGNTPEGEGLIWDSRDSRVGEIYGNIIPYIWLGGAERGICWFADNDRGWVIHKDEKEGYAPCLTLRREGGELVLRLNLVQEPITLEEPRTIVFGLMASPGKPMPEGWRNIRKGQAVNPKQFPRVRTIHGIHAANHLFGNDHFRGPYPSKKDWSLFDKAQEIRLFGQKPGGDAKTFLKRWNERHPDSDGPNLVFRRTMCDIFSIYAEEFHMVGKCIDRDVFGDEWSGPGRNKSQMRNLAPSYIDFRAWVASHFVRRGMGVYFDNTWPQETDDTVTGTAYTLPNGDIQPSYGMWSRREYFRRIWTIHHTMNPTDPRCQPEMQLHMTNGHILPFMTWNDCNLDLEWRRAAPMNRAFSSELMLTESTGLQTGCRPWAFLWGDEMKAFGSLMVHEVIPWGNPGPYRTYLPMLYEIGYGLPDCNIHNYWDPKDPVRTSNDKDVKSLLVERDGKAMLILCSWNPEPETVEVEVAPDGLGYTPESITFAKSGEPAKGARGGRFEVDLDGYGAAVFRLE